MAESGSHRYSNLIDVTQMPLAQLRMLDDAVLEESVDPFWRACDSAADRRWHNDSSVLD